MSTKCLIILNPLGRVNKPDYVETQTHVTLSQAILGGTVEVDTIYGTQKMVSLTSSLAKSVVVVECI